MAVPVVESSSTAANQTTSTFAVSPPSGIANGNLLYAIQCSYLGGGNPPRRLLADGRWRRLSRLTLEQLTFGPFIRSHRPSQATTRSMVPVARPYRQ